VPRQLGRHIRVGNPRGDARNLDAGIEALAHSRDAAVAGTDLGCGSSRRSSPRWWAVLRGSAWTVFAVAVVGALWLLALGAAIAVIGLIGRRAGGLCRAELTRRRIDESVAGSPTNSS